MARATSDELRAAGTPDTDATVIEGLRQHRDVRVRVLCARHPRLSDGGVLALAGDSAAAVRAAVAGRAALPATLVSRLVGDRDARVRRTVVRHQDIDVEQLIAIIESGNGTPVMEQRLVAHLRADAALTARLFEEPRWRWIASRGRFESKAAGHWGFVDRWAGLMIALHASLSDAAVHQLARSKFPEIQEAVADRRDLSSRVRLRIVLFGRRNAAAQLLRREQPRTVRVVAACRRSTAMRAARVSSSTSSYFLWHSAASAHFSIQLAVALNPAAGPRARKRLRSSLRWALDEALARREDLEDFEYLALARHGAVLLRLATNPRTPLAAIDWMIAHGDQFVSQLSRIHPARPIERIHKVADDGNAPKWLLRRLAASPLLPAEVQERILVWLALGGGTGDPNFDPFTCVGTPGDVGQPRDQAFREVGGEHAVESSLWMTRLMKSMGSSTMQVDAVLRLARDSHPAVRVRAAGFNGVVSARELRSDPDPSVRRQAEATWNQIPSPLRRRQRRRSAGRVGGVWLRGAIIAAVALLIGTVIRKVDDASTSPTSTSDPRDFIDRLDQPTWVVASGPSPLLENELVCRSATTTVHVVRDGIATNIDVSSGPELVPVDFRLYAGERLLDEFEAGVRAGAHGTYQVASFEGTRVEVRVGENADRRMVVPMDASLDVMVPDREGDC